MLIKLGEDNGRNKAYIIDSKDKEALLKVISEYLNQYMRIELIATKSGGFTTTGAKARECILDYKKEYRTWYENIAYYKLDNMCNSELTAYKWASKLYSIFSEIEKELPESSIQNIDIAISDLNDIVLNFPEYEVFEKYKEQIQQAKKEFDIL